MLKKRCEQAVQLHMMTMVALGLAMIGMSGFMLCYVRTTEPAVMWPLIANVAGWSLFVAANIMSAKRQAQKCRIASLCKP